MTLDDNKPIIIETGEIIPPEKWTGCNEDDGDYLVYYTDSSGRCWGTQSTAVSQ